MPELLFKIASSEESARMIFDFRDILKEELKGKKVTSWSPILQKLPENVMDMLLTRKRFGGKLKEELVEICRTDRKKLVGTKDFLEREWSKLDDIFWKRISHITGFGWEHRRYICYVNDMAVGHYNPPRKIGISEREVYNVAEELFHLHYWDIFQKIFPKTKEHPAENERNWVLSEVIVEYALLEDPVLSKFWMSKGIFTILWARTGKFWTRSGKTERISHLL